MLRVESPTHEIRADADPSARSAKSIVITLANRHTFDRPVEILIHPSEPHMPHILMEEGDMTPAEYEQHLKGKNDFIKGIKKDPSMEIIRKRLHKDIPHHPVLMLNFCPELSAAPADLQKAAGEFIFLVDCSGSSTSIGHAKDALLVALKSLMPACLFNIITFSSTFKILFPASRTYCEVSAGLAVACESIRRMHADTGSPNILSPLKWIIRQPIRRGHPRLLFLLSHGAVDNAGMVLELLRNHSCSTRCYSFGIGPRACRRLVQGAAAVSRGIAEFLVEGERLQPKLIRSLKKAMAPVLSDVSVEWVFPESTEVLVSPLSSSCLFPGDRLVGYSIICDTSLYTSKPRAVSATLLPLSLSSLAETHISPPVQIGREPLGPECLGDALQVCPSRGVKLNVFAFPSPSLPPHASPPPGSAVQAPAGPPCCSKALYPPATAPRPHQHLTWLWDGVQGYSMPACSPHPTAGALGSQVMWERDLEAVQHPSFTFETETSSDYEPQDWDSGATRGSPRSPRASCKAVVKGLRGGEPRQWEITFDLPALLRERDGQEEGEEDVWSETFHQLAARAVIRDLELLAERERDIEHGNGASASCRPGRRYQLNAVHTSKSCNVISKYTAFVPVEQRKHRLPSIGEQLSPGQGTPGPSSIVSGGPFGDRNLLFPHTGCMWLVFRASRCSLQVSLQLACGAFLMNSAFCEAVSIPMEKLRWTSPFSCHRLQPEQWDASISEADSTDIQMLLLDIELQKQTEPEGMLWATAVALAWLEHSSASHFTEWELVAAKASLWLGEQDFPQGCSLAAVKSAAQQLFVLLRHWDENLEFNLLCYNPSSV
uniref:von Willebrand factor A domain containing 5B1 n=1 Tax=Coturnix japonica TaxID=93934 RepID=A0A8C2U530_COTJA